MKEIFKTLKKYSLIIVFIISLLAVQAYCDLKLPEVTSKIVDIGIQQKAVEYAVPEVIREEEYNKIKLFLNKEERQLLDNNYKLINKKNKDYDYDYLKNNKIYVLNTDNKLVIEDMENEFIFGFTLLNTFNNLSKEDLSKFGLNIDTDIYTYLNSLDEENLYIFQESINEKFNNVETSLLKQSVIMNIDNEYKTVGVDVEDNQLDYIKISGLKMLLLAFLMMLITLITSFLSSRLAAFFSRDLRSKIMKKIMLFSNKELEDFSAASLITRTTNDVGQVQMILTMFFRIVVYAPIIGIGAFTKVIDSEMNWVIGLSLGLIFILIVVLFSITFSSFQKTQKLIDKLNLVSREILTGIPVIRAFATEKHEEKRFDEANKDITKLGLFINRVMNVMMPMMNLIMNGTIILIIWVGAKNVDLGNMQVGTLIAFISYTMQIIISFLMISMVSIMLPRSIVSIRRIAEIFNKEISVKETIVPKRLKNYKSGLIEFKDVYFKYPDALENVLEDISFTAKPGTVTAIIGSTGSGKSTLINLIPRLFDVTAGKILFDGVNIKDVKLKDLRERIGFIPQKGTLFSGTIKENISFTNKRVTKDMLELASNISQSSEFINNLDKKYDYEISQSGKNVSGGQKQRLCIARAIASDPDVYIFDDSFSALDYKTDLKLRKELAKVTKNKTIIIVAQRISTIMNADQIIVLDNGRVVGIGTHKELMKDNAVYQEIAYSQFKKEEIDNG